MSDQQVANPKRVMLGRAVTLGSAARVVEAPFPKFRTIQWVPQSVPDPDEEPTSDSPNIVEMVITQEVLLAVNRHVAQTLERELGGFLLGNRYSCPDTQRNYVVIDQYLEAGYTEGTEVSLSFTSESWAQLDDHLSGKFLGKLLVGWYHSHPKLNVYLSSLDVAIHEGRFREPWKSALVLEPATHQGGFFRWNRDKLDRNNYVDFYELLDGESRETVVAWSNYKGIDPKTNKPPYLKKVNTKTGQGSTIYDSGEYKPVLTELPDSGKVTGRQLRKNPWILFGILIILTLAVVFTILKLNLDPIRISKVSNQNVAPYPTRTPENPTPTPPRIQDTVLRTLKVDVQGIPLIDFQNSRIKVQLQISKIPENVVVAVQDGMKVTIDDHEADIQLQSIGPDGFTVNASTELREKIASLKQQDMRQEVTLLASFDHNENEVTIEKGLTLAPIVTRGRLPRVEVGVRNVGRTIRRNTGTGKTQATPKTGEGAKEAEGATPSATKTGAENAGKSGKPGTGKKTDESLLDKVINTFRGKRGTGQ